VTIPSSKWRWDGHPGHLIVAGRCRFHLHTRIGDYRISTIGDWFPEGWEGETGKKIGVDRTHETFVFRVTGPGVGESDWSEIDTDVYNDCDDAAAGHMAMCRKYARLA
jgi:hypothetical protein